MKSLRIMILAFIADMQMSYASNSTQNQSCSCTENMPVCGVRGGGAAALLKIAGGSIAIKHEFPWQAALLDKKKKLLCGAVVIRQEWVASASHCLQGYKPHEITVVAGEHHLLKDEGVEQRVVGQKIFVHPQYVAVTEENDIGLIHLAQALRFDGKTVMPICMPTPDHLTDGYPHTSCVVTGWGSEKEGGDKSNVLLKVMVPLISDEKCRDCFLKEHRKVTDQMLCAGYPQGGKDSCQADSGGPLACRKEGNVYFLAGLVSWGKGCAEPNLPGVYTEVAHYLSWMNAVING
uniref:Peptidase S1 domain-containing protein n=1 Tax=Scylla olivacea TaxID=85551 RepID=A0A0P4WPP4_SCYOL